MAEVRSQPPFTANRSINYQPLTINHQLLTINHQPLLTNLHYNPNLAALPQTTKQVIVNTASARGMHHHKLRLNEIKISNPVLYEVELFIVDAPFNAPL